MGLPLFARAPVELAEAEVTAGDEGAHAELSGEGQRLVVVAFGGLDVGRIEMGRDLGKNAQPIRLMASVATLAGAIQLALSQGHRLVRSTVKEERFAQPGEGRSIVIPDSHAGGLIDGVTQ